MATTILLYHQVRNATRTYIPHWRFAKRSLPCYCNPSAFYSCHDGPHLNIAQPSKPSTVSTDPLGVASCMPILTI